MRTIFYHRWFLAMWPSQHEFDMLLKRDYKLALDLVLKEIATGQTNAKSEETRIRRVLACLLDENQNEQRVMIDHEYLNPVLNLLYEIGDIDLVLDFFKQSGPILKQQTFDYTTIAKMIVLFELDVFSHGLSAFLKPTAKMLTTHIKITQVDQIT